MDIGERSPRWTRALGRPVLGVTMIVRDEAARLPSLLADIAELADEVVVVDTGSTDGTRDVCRDWGVTLLERPWRDDFSYARNQGLEAARALHLLWLDGDDRVSAATARALAGLRDARLGTDSDVAFQLTVSNRDALGAPLDSFRQVRIFPNRAAIRYRGAIHESFMEALGAAGIRVETLPLELEHHGYSTPEVRRAKAERNAGLLRRALRDSPGDTNARIHLAQALSGLGEPGEAAALLAEVLRLAEGTRGHEPMLAELRAIRAGYLLAAGDATAAAQDLDTARRLRPNWGVAAVRRAELHAADGQWDRVERILEDAALDFDPGAFGSPVERLRRTREWLRGRCRLERGDPEGALGPLTAAFGRGAAAMDARLDLGQALLDLGRFARAREVLEPLGEDEDAAARLFEVLTAIGLARAATGDTPAALACLSPLIDLLAELLTDPDGASVPELASALASVGQATAARNLLAVQPFLEEAASSAGSPS